MFGLLDDTTEYVPESVEDFTSDPLGYVVESAVNPVNDTFEVLEGLSEGEIRERAIMRLGADVVGGMALSEAIDFLLED